MGLSRMPIACNQPVTMVPIAEEVTRRLIPRECFVIWRAIHSAVGFVVTLIQTRSLRSGRMMMKASSEIEANGRDDEQIHGGDFQHVSAGRCSIPDLAIAVSGTSWWG